MSFYDVNGYLDFRRIRDLGYPYTIILGGRAVGKTYGALRSSVEDDINFMLLRRTQRQLDIINKPIFSPIRPVCRDTGLQITMRSVAPGLAAFVPYEVEEETGKEIVTGDPLGYTAALSTFSNLRGFDASHVQILLFDEFIPEKGERPIKNEADALWNCYESINRNRELDGRPPLQLILMANANDQTAPVLESLKLITRIEKMRKTGQEMYVDRSRGLCLILLRDSPISERKRDTALYRLTDGTSFADMALDNDFAYEERGRIVSRPLAEYKPLVRVGEVTVYRHKAERKYYASLHASGSPPSFGTGDGELQRFRHSYGWLWEAQMTDSIEYEDYMAQVLLTKYIN